MYSLYQEQISKYTLATINKYHSNKEKYSIKYSNDIPYIDCDNDCGYIEDYIGSLGCYSIFKTVIALYDVPLINKLSLGHGYITLSVEQYRKYGERAIMVYSFGNLRMYEYDGSVKRIRKLLLLFCIDPQRFIVRMKQEIERANYSVQIFFKEWQRQINILKDSPVLSYLVLDTFLVGDLRKCVMQRWIEVDIERIMRYVT